MTASRARRPTRRRRRRPWPHFPPSVQSRPCTADALRSWSSPLAPRPRPPPPRSTDDGVPAAAAAMSPSSPPPATLPPPPPPPPCTTDDLQTTSTAITDPPHRHRCLATANRRRRLAQRVAASPARRPTCRQRRRRPSLTAPTAHHREPSYPDRLPKVNVPSKKTLLFLQPLPPASPMLRRGPPPSLFTAPRRQPAIPLTSALRRSTTGNGNGRDRSSSHATRNHTTPPANV